MSADILQLVSEQSVDSAWEVYRRKAVELVANPSLIADRGFNEELARRHAKWLKLFLLQDHAK